MRAFVRAAALAAATWASVWGSAQAQDNYPSREVTVVIPYAAGGGGDPIARVLFDALSKRLGQPVILDFRPGGGAMIGARVVATSAPDGYTLMFTTKSPLVNANFAPGGPPYDPVNDFIIVIDLITTPNIITAHSTAPYNTVDELIAYAKANPGKINAGVGGLGGGGHTALATVEYKAGVKFNIVPYTGTGTLLPDLLSNTVELAASTPTAFLPGVKSGRLKYIAVLSPKRSIMLPDVPSADESSHKGMYYDSYYTISVSKGTPRAIIDRLNAEFNAILKDETIARKMNEFGFEVVGGTPEEGRAIVNQDITNLKGMLDTGVFKLQ